MNAQNETPAREREMPSTVDQNPVESDPKMQRHLKHMAKRFHIYEARERAMRRQRRVLMSKKDRLLTMTLADVLSPITRFFRIKS
jgi:hypothetical protein